jgi:iron-sulfur cluster assembly protein
MKKMAPVTITEKALRKINEIMKEKQISDDYLLRLGVKSAGCGIASHIIGFDHSGDNDEVFKVGNIKVAIEKAQVMYLAGKTVDYGEADGQIGFIFRDPN